MCEESERLAQPGPSGVSRTADRNKDQVGIETSVSVNFDKVIDNGVSSSNKKQKHNYEELYGNSTPGTSKKRSYEELLFGDISDLLGRDVSGMIINGKLQA